MKKLIISSILIVGLTAGYVFAHGNGSNRMGGHNMKGGQSGMMSGAGMAGGCQGQGPQMFIGKEMSDEQRQQFLDATTPLRKQMSEKRFELREAARNKNSTPAQLAVIEKEIVDIRASIHEQALKFQTSTK